MDSLLALASKKKSELVELKDEKDCALFEHEQLQKEIEMVSKSKYQELKQHNTKILKEINNALESEINRMKEEIEEIENST